MGTRRRRSRKGRPSWLLPVLGVALMGVAAALWMLVHPADKAADVPVVDDGFAHVIRSLAARRDIGFSSITEDDPIRKQGTVFVRTWKLAVPRQAIADALASDLIAEASRRGLAYATRDGGTREIARLRITGEVEAFDIRFSAKTRKPSPKTTAPAGSPSARAPAPDATPLPPERPAGRLAILLDDAGQNMDLIPEAESLPAEVGVAVLPFLPSSAESAEALYRAGHEVWLHLPMEPAGFPEENPGSGAVFVAMPESEIRTTVHAAINNVPHVVGVNNHMGSKATTDFRTMTWVMQEIKGRGLAFIDSRTAVATVAEDAARALGVPTGRRHIFLDNDRTASAVHVQLEQAVLRVLAGEDIVAIGHVAPITIEVLSQEAPRLRSRGVNLVAPSAIVN